MSLLEPIKQHRGIVAIVVVVVLSTVLFFAFRQPDDRVTFSPSQKAFYTVDDGRSWFEDDISKPSPFSRDGKLAYRCYVYSHAGGTNLFVSHIERYSDEAEKVREGLQKSGKAPDPVGSQTLLDGVEVKRPGTGDKGWIKMRDPRSTDVTVPKDPQGVRGDLTPVEP